MYDKPKLVDDIITSCVNGQWTQAKRQFKQLDMYDKETFINIAFEHQNERMLTFCKLLLKEYLD